MGHQTTLQRTDSSVGVVLTSYRISVPPPPRCRLVRLRSIQSCLARSQSSMSSISLPVTGPSPGRAPRLSAAVSGDSRRAMASFESGAMTLATTAASARLRLRLRLRCRVRFRPSSPRGPEGRGDVAVGQRALDIHQPGDVGDRHRPLEHGS